MGENSNEIEAQYFNVAIAVSVVLFGFDGKSLKTLIHSRKEEPFKGTLVLPSKYMNPEHSVEKVVHQLLEEHIGIKDAYIEQLKAFAKVFRNPMGRVINISFYSVVKLDKETIAAHDAKGRIWVDYNEIPDLAFDHNEIVAYAKERLKRRVKRRPMGFNLLPEAFTIAQLQKLYEVTLGMELDKRNFRKKIFHSELIIETGKTTDPSITKKVSKLYKFDISQYEKMSLKGYDFLF